jgi:predicted ATPase
MKNEKIEKKVKKNQENHSMTLIYMYIGNINRCVKNQSISFSNEFTVKYDIDNKRMTIEQNEETTENIYGKNILNLNLIVGKNGCGKSTILDLLGLNNRDRITEFSFTTGEEPCSWFALYHLYGNNFAVEGYNCELLNFDKYLKNVYSIGFRYDYAEHQMVYYEPLQEYEIVGKKKWSGINNHIFYLSYQVEPRISWYTTAKRTESSSTDYYLFGRQYLDTIGYESVIDYLFNSTRDKVIVEKMGIKHNACVKIKLKQNTSQNVLSSEWINGKTTEKFQEEVETALYACDEKLMDKPNVQLNNYFHVKSEYTLKQSMIIRYLEALVWYALSNKMHNYMPKYQPNQNKYLYRKKYLLEYLKNMEEETAQNYETMNIHFVYGDYQIAEKICESLEKVPDKYYLDPDIIEVPFSSMQENFLLDLMKTLDEDSNDDGGHVVRHQHFIQVSFEQLSSGEAYFLDLYASIYWGLKKSKNQAKGDTCILLLDEPDSRFHPEWSRTFISYLVKNLKSELFSDYNYQILITTHSPLLLSDVPKGNIICMNKTNENSVRIETAKYGFMSNLNDILIDSFFTASPFGEFAENYVNDIITSINRFEKNIRLNSDKSINKDKVSQELLKLQNKLKIVDEPRIRESLCKRIEDLQIRLQILDHGMGIDESIREIRQKQIQILKNRILELEAYDQN